MISSKLGLLLFGDRKYLQNGLTICLYLFASLHCVYMYMQLNVKMVSSVWLEV